MSGAPGSTKVGDAPAHPVGEPGFVIGDGTTARTRARSRWRRARAPLAILGTLALVGLLAALPEPRTSQVPLAPDNAQPLGARALAQILDDHGVRVQYTRRMADVLASDGPGVTVAVLGDSGLTDETMQALEDVGGDLVVVGAPWAASTLVQVQDAYSFGEPTTRDARCRDTRAAAAGTVRATASARAPSNGVACFPGPDDDVRAGAYVSITLAGGRHVDVLADAAMVTNSGLAAEGNASLALSTFGRNPDVVWYVPAMDDPYGRTAADEQLGSTMPPWTGPLMLQLLLVAVVAAVWRGRRTGPLVTERLPVVVRGGETTRGRGRLYRRGRAHGHAAAALRAAAAARCAARLGLPRSAAAPAVIEAVARASGRPGTAVEQLLYGPPPTDDAGLARLARDLDHLESEVHRT